MALLPIVQYPDERLMKTCTPVTEFTEDLKKLAADMAETMYEAPGVGLAAPQVGVNIRMVVIDVTERKDGLMTLCNPVVTPVGDEVVCGEEGCLSLPGVYDKVKRAAKVRVNAQDLDGKDIEFEAEGLLAVCAQHETDHLDGHVFIDHLSMLKKGRAVAKLAKLRKEKARKKNSEDRE